MNTMSVVQAGMSLQSTRLAQAIGTSVLKMGLDVQKMEGEAALQLLEAASIPPPNTGQNINTVA